MLVGWFCLLAAAVIAYNALWYPRTFFGAHYYKFMVQSVGLFTLANGSTEPFQYGRRTCGESPVL